MPDDVSDALNGISQQLREMRSRQEGKHEENQDRFGKLEIELVGFGFKYQELARELGLLRQELHGLKEPVGELTALRNKVGIVAGVVMGCSAFVAPFFYGLWQLWLSSWLPQWLGWKK
jgi:hypothetical protein